MDKSFVKSIKDSLSLGRDSVLKSGYGTNNQYLSIPISRANPEATLQELMDYTISLFANENLIAEELKAYKAAKKISGKDKVKAFLEVYRSLEKNLLKLKPPEVRKGFDGLEAIREDIFLHVDTTHLDFNFKLLFVLEGQEELYAYEIFSEELARKPLEIVGTKELRKYIEEKTKGTVLTNLKVIDSGLDFTLVHPKLLELTREPQNHKELTDTFKSLNTMLIEKMTEHTGKDKAQLAMLDEFETVKTSENAELIEHVADILPL